MTYRSEINFDDDLSFDYVNLVSTKDKALVMFMTSSLESDVGQNVVPYIDVQPISSTPSTLFSGAGIIYRQAKGSSGFMSLKLKTYDYSSHLNLDSRDEKALDELTSQYGIHIKRIL
ncbi:hypothetical protein TSAR_001363 [Trichomalopsis sarcophagae]|uniref:Uncharacterized protein n=1 Tax=Trichomalopsis sarcophagae TaxID=543379 RepID=A0A232ESI8_9HYME|nr:hypothetical protein TSAR_001363 [Trichomalopsis sarcophagae]